MVPFAPWQTLWNVGAELSFVIFLGGLLEVGVIAYKAFDIQDYHDSNKKACFQDILNRYSLVRDCPYLMLPELTGCGSQDEQESKRVSNIHSQPENNNPLAAKAAQYSQKIHPLAGNANSRMPNSPSPIAMKSYPNNNSNNEYHPSKALQIPSS